MEATWFKSADKVIQPEKNKRYINHTAYKILEIINKNTFIK